MARITISEELEKKLGQIKDSDYTLRYDRGLESTVAHLVEKYEIYKDISSKIDVFGKKILETIDERVEHGVIEALKKWIMNIVSFGKP